MRTVTEAIEWQIVTTGLGKNEPGPTLRTAFQRVKQALIRADELQGLERRMQEAVLANPVTFIVPREELQRGEFGSARFEGEQAFTLNMLPDARVLASEIIHHLRTALEYLAYQVVWLDAGHPFEGSKFPMCHKSREWERERERCLPGVSDAHALIIKRLQPFKHCRWVAQLQGLSNTDKHRQVLDVRQLLRGDPVRLTEIGHPHPHDERLWIVQPTTQRISVELADETNALETLAQLCAETAKVLKLAQRDFGESVSLDVAVDGQSLT